MTRQSKLACAVIAAVLLLGSPWSQQLIQSRLELRSRSLSQVQVIHFARVWLEQEEAQRETSSAETRQALLREIEGSREDSEAALSWSSSALASLSAQQLGELSRYRDYCSSARLPRTTRFPSIPTELLLVYERLTLEHSYSPALEEALDQWPTLRREDRPCSLLSWLDSGLEPPDAEQVRKLQGAVELGMLGLARGPQRVDLLRRVLGEEWMQLAGECAREHGHDTHDPFILEAATADLRARSP